jgi:hypothetical protein
MADAAVRDGAGQAGEKGLRSGALGMLSGIVIGVASTAPGYSVAASLGLVALHRSHVPVLVVRTPSSDA